MNLPTGSGIARALACPASQALPRVERSSEYAERGDWRHKFVELVGQVGAEKALEAIPEEYRDECEGIDIEGLPTELATEVTFAWCYETGKVRELGRNLGRDYSDAKPTEIVGTIDVVGVGPEEVYVADYKGFEWVSARSPQLLFAAFCASKVYSRHHATTEVMQLDGSGRRNRATMDTFDLWAFEAKLREMVTAIIDAQEQFDDGLWPTVTEGKHCKYCPAFDSCPAKTRLLREMTAPEDGPFSLRLDEATAADAYRKWLIMKDLTKRVGEALYGYASEHPIDLGDGRVFGPREKAGKESLDGDIAYAQIREFYGQEIADIATGRTATKEGIKAAAKAAKAAGKVKTIKEGEEGMLALIRANNGAKRKTSTVIGEHRKQIPA